MTKLLGLILLLSLVGCKPRSHQSYHEEREVSTPRKAKQQVPRRQSKEPEKQEAPVVDPGAQTPAVEALPGPAPAAEVPKTEPLPVPAKSTLAANASPIEHVIVIGLEGVGSKNLWRKELSGVPAPKIPTMTKFVKEGAFSLSATSDAMNRRGSNLNSMFTGSSSSAHGVLDDDCRGNKELDSIFSLVQRQKSNAEVGFIYESRSLRCFANGSSMDFQKRTRRLRDTSEEAVEYIQSKKPNFLFIHFGEIAEEARDHGGASRQYVEKVEEVDREISAIVNAASATFGEAGAVIITGTHAANLEGKGMATSPESVPFLVLGGGVNKGPIDGDLANQHVAPLSAFLLGLEPSDDWEATIDAFMDSPELPSEIAGETNEGNRQPSEEATEVNEQAPDAPPQVPETAPQVPDAPPGVPGMAPQVPGTIPQAPGTTRAPNR